MVGLCKKPQHLVGHRLNPLDSDAAIVRMKQGDDLCSPIGEILMGLFERGTLRVPILALIGLGTVGAGLIFCPNGQA